MKPRKAFDSLPARRGTGRPSRCAIRACAVVNKQAANPFEDLLPGTADNGSLAVRSQLLRTHPQFTSISRAWNSIGQCWQDALQVQLEKRLLHGMHLLAGHTLSKATEAVGCQNARVDINNLAKALTSFDTPQRFLLSGSY